MLQAVIAGYRSTQYSQCDDVTACDELVMWRVDWIPLCHCYTFKVYSTLTTSGHGNETCLFWTEPVRGRRRFTALCFIRIAIGCSISQRPQVGYALGHYSKWAKLASSSSISLALHIINRPHPYTCLHILHWNDWTHSPFEWDVICGRPLPFTAQLTRIRTG